MAVVRRSTSPSLAETVCMARRPRGSGWPSVGARSARGCAGRSGTPAALQLRRTSRCTRQQRAEGSPHVRGGSGAQTAAGRRAARPHARAGGLEPVLERLLRGLRDGGLTLAAGPCRARTGDSARRSTAGGGDPGRVDRAARRSAARSRVCRRACGGPGRAAGWRSRYR